MQQQPRIIVKNPDIGQPEPIDMSEQAGDAVNEYLATDEANIRMAQGLFGQMFAVAEPDLEPDGPRPLREQTERINGLAAGWHRHSQPRKQVCEEPLTVRCQPPTMPAPMPIRPIAPRRIGHR